MRNRPWVAVQKPRGTCVNRLDHQIGPGSRPCQRQKTNKQRTMRNEKRTTDNEKRTMRNGQRTIQKKPENIPQRGGLPSISFPVLRFSLSVSHCPLSVVSRPFLIVRCPLSVVRFSLSVVRCQFYIKGSSGTGIRPPCSLRTRLRTAEMARKAWPLWLIWFFSSRVSWAMVKPRSGRRKMGS